MILKSKSSTTSKMPPDEQFFEDNDIRNISEIESDLKRYTLEEESSSSSSLTTLTDELDRSLVELNDGIVHGHIHNFENFTYIHGHIHRNEASQNLNSTQHNIPAQRRLSSHRHSNDLHSLNFSDCQHFEFLNCHDHKKNPVETFVCEENENCVPKIVEICCDDTHNQGNPSLLAGLPTCTDLLGHNNSSSASEIPANDSLNFDKDVFQHCNFEDCVDVKCDLDSCTLDEMYCQASEDVDIKKEEGHLGAFNSSYRETCKRIREEDDHHQHNLHHFHHPHQHSHSEKHHHHHIQLHDHPTKRPKYLKDSSTNSTTPFEWNFKNMAKCGWINCSQTLDNSITLQNHIVEDHILTEYDKDLQSYECEWQGCDYFTDELSTLVDHITQQHSSNGSHLSDLIFKKEKGIQELPTPSNSPITEQQKKQPAIEQTVCKWLLPDKDGQLTVECNHQFDNVSELQDHLIQDHVGSGQSQYTCCWANCDRNSRCFNQRQKIIRHLHVHTRFKPFVCSVCNRSFAVETMLDQHMRTHSGEKPYSCKVCQKTFATSSSLSIHIRTHTGEKPLCCKYPNCGKRFSESSNLTKHMKTHEKTYKCEFCSKSFGKEKQLSSHMVKYHEDKT